MAVEWFDLNSRRAIWVDVGGGLSLWPRDFQQKCCHPLALLCQRFSLQDPGGREGDFCYMRMVVEMGLRSKCCCCWPAPRPLSLKDAPRGQELLLHGRIFQRFVATRCSFSPLTPPSPTKQECLGMCHFSMVPQTIPEFFLNIVSMLLK